MTESKNTPDSEAAPATPPTEEAPTDAASVTPAIPAETTSSSDVAPTPGVEAPAADADATLISPPATDPEATLEAPAAPPATDAAVTPPTDAPAAETTDATSPATGAETTAPVEPPAADGATETTPTDAPAVDASVGADAAVSDASAAPVTDAPAADAPAGETPRPATLPADAAGGALRSDRINLVASSGQAMSVGVKTTVGKHIVRQFGEESNVWDTEQFVLERTTEGAWQIVPREGTTNETLVNGEAVTAPRPLHDGDVIAVGRVEKGIVKLPLTARAG